jgi:nicotinate dehydrogenase subunit B
MSPLAVGGHDTFVFQDGEIRVKCFYVTHDCGQIINPDGLRNQTEVVVLDTDERPRKVVFSYSGASGLES